MNFAISEFQWMLEHRSAFWGSMLVMFAVVAGLLYLFRLKRWL